MDQSGHCVVNSQSFGRAWCNSICGVHLLKPSGESGNLGEVVSVYRMCGYVERVANYMVELTIGNTRDKMLLEVMTKLRSTISPGFDQINHLLLRPIL